jgi:hypothetical protein
MPANEPLLPIGPSDWRDDCPAGRPFSLTGIGIAMAHGSRAAMAGPFSYSLC